MVMLVLVGLLGLAVVGSQLPLAIVWLYLAASVIAFAVYAWDKSAARHGQWRVPEMTLHLLAVLGGWPGAFMAQRWLRHKSRKATFQRMFWLTVILNGGALVWLWIALLHAM